MPEWIPFLLWGAATAVVLSVCLTSTGVARFIAGFQSAACLAFLVGYTLVLLGANHLRVANLVLRPAGIAMACALIATTIAVTYRAR